MENHNRIKSIKIKNVKGLKNYVFSPNEYLIPNKPTIFVAPNGFGKSSITTAFKSLLKTKIKLSPLDYNEQNVTNKPLLSIVTSDIHGNNELEFHADENKNTIDKAFDIEVINSPLKAKKKSLGGGNSYAVIDIEPLIIWNIIPQKETISYSVLEYRKHILKNAKLYKNIASLINNKKFICDFKNNINYKKFELKTSQKIIKDFKEKLYKIKPSEIETINIDSLKQIPELTKITALIAKYNISIYEEVDLYIQAIQVVDIISAIPMQKFTNIYKYYSYCLEKDKFKNRIKEFDNAWLKLKLKEHKNKLIAEFPNPTLISNGQRDILVFIAKLLRAEVKLHNTNSILIIDEIFDYLDEANLVSAQYYINKFINTFKEKNKHLYIIIMTHLDPIVFNTYHFKDVHIQYLSKSARKPNEKIIEKFLIYRNKSENKFTEDEINKISKYYLHFHPDNQDFTEKFNSLSLEKISTKNKFNEYLNKHFDLYKEENRSFEYDPLAVCCYVRNKIEENIYNLLDEEQREKFLNTKTTSKKLEYVESLNIDVKETYYLLNIVHNEAIHCKNNVDNYTRLYSKLENLTIRNLILSI